MKIAIVFLLALFECLSAAGATQAATSCSKDCRDFQRACEKAHSQAACKTDYDICMKHCKQRRNAVEATMKKLAALVLLMICCFVGYEVSSVAEDGFKKLSGAEIRAKFSGMEFTDQVHWGEVYEVNGKLASEEMGKKRTGTWRIEKNQLCTDYGKEIGSACYDVWLSGKNVQLRIQDSPADPLVGVLERPRRQQ